MNVAGAIIGIDATNIRGGGGVTHLVELLEAAAPEATEVSMIVVWGGTETLRRLPDRTWLKKVEVPELNGGLLRRSWWQFHHLSRAAKAENCDVLFVPGGSFMGNFKPVVTFSQNLLPFDSREILRFGVSRMALKLLILRWTQLSGFRRSSAVIFLTEAAKLAVTKNFDTGKAEHHVIPHGVSAKFKAPYRPHRILENCTFEDPFRLLYISQVDMYKHQWVVAEAVALLRLRGVPIAIDFIGAAYPPALNRLQSVINRLDKNKRYLRYLGFTGYEEIQTAYRDADAFVFASSCETFGQILLEAMSAGIPIAASNTSVVSEVLGDAGVYFDCSSAEDIARVVGSLAADRELRDNLAAAGRLRAEAFSWGRCAAMTLAVLASVASRHNQLPNHHARPNHTA